MAPSFFEENLALSDEYTLSEDSSKHAVQVLRMKEGEQMILTNGKGQTSTAEIIYSDKKSTKVKIISSHFSERVIFPKAIAISLIKNSNRFEWFVEKATEVGISYIIPLICKRSEKVNFKKERIRAISISAMLQSQQSWLPEISDPVKFDNLMNEKNFDQKFIAHCLPDQKTELKNVVKNSASGIILIGPEGDFTEEEIEKATGEKYLPVSLGKTRLRTETAGVVAAVLMVQV